MKKVVYVSFLDESKLAGYKYKIHSQCYAIKNIGFEVYLLILSEDEVVLYNFIGEKETVVFRRKNSRKIAFNKLNALNKLFLFKYFMSQLDTVIEEIKPDFIYVRRIAPITPLLIKTIKKHRNQGIKIYYEYPTYPWEKELIAEKRFLLYFLDKVQFSSLKKAVNQLVIVGADEKNYKEPYKVISNAIRVEDIPIITDKKPIDSKIINMVGIANVNLFHGFDRIIYGLENYCREVKEVRVKFHIIGKISESLNLKELVTDLNLTNYVIFHGHKEGQELDDLFNGMHIGVGCLGVHRKNVTSLNSLKNREYAARGLPFIFSERDDVIEKQNPPFILKESFDDEPINICQIINFYQDLKVEAQDIRNFAIKYLNWETEMEKVFGDERI